MATLPDSVAEARGQVRVLLDEPTAAFWTDDEIDSWVVEATGDVATKTLCFEAKNTAVDVVDNQVYADEPTDCIKINSIQFYDGDAGTYRGMAEIHPRLKGHLPNSNTSGGDPYYWFHYRSRIYLDPIPVSTHANDKLHVYFAQYTSDMTDLPDEYQPFIIKYATAMARLKERKNVEAVRMYVEYLNDLRYHRADLLTHPVDSQDMLHQPDRTVRAR